VCFQRRGDGEARGGIPVEDVHQLLFLQGADHDGAALRVCGQMLSRYDTAAAGLSKRLLMHFGQHILGGVVLQNSDARIVERRAPVLLCEKVWVLRGGEEGACVGKEM